MKRRAAMEYFAGLDVSMEETHVCVCERDGKVILEARTPTAPKTIAAALAKGPAVGRVLFETGRMAPTLFHGLTALGMPVVCVESRQAYQALRSMVTHKTDRNNARGLAHLARAGFFKPVHVKSLPSHAVRALLIARKKLVGQRVTLENQIRGLAVAFGVRLPRGLSHGFSEKAMAAGRGIPGLDGAMRGLLAARDAILKAIVAINADMKSLERSSAACRRLMTIPGMGRLTRTGLRCRDRRSRSLPSFA